MGLGVHPASVKGLLRMRAQPCVSQQPCTCQCPGLASLHAICTFLTICVRRVLPSPSPSASQPHSTCLPPFLPPFVDAHPDANGGAAPAAAAGAAAAGRGPLADAGNVGAMTVQEIKDALTQVGKGGGVVERWA